MKAETSQMRKYRNLIIGKLVSIQNSADETIKDLRNRNENPPDFYDQASLETDRSINLILRELDQRSVHEMKEAMRRLEEGTFGVCTVCHKPIAKRRLQVNPTATLCVACKEREEKGNRRAARSGGWRFYEMESPELG